jgi:uncharacterized protein YyaL (SSP411 family)
MPNRLERESSPYLQQHAHNPVDWYPWGREALDLARERDCPILLSVGYSACHWCHVMEHESFSDPSTAEVMNRDFVNVKVDREERPDVDGIYMRAVQALTGQGGWPLTAFLTPDGKPFYGGTYFPPRPRHGMPAFTQVLAAVADAWRNRRDNVLENAGHLLEAIEKSGREADPGSGRFQTGAVPGPELSVHAFRHLASRFDPVHGGFGGAPKFPQPVTLEFLLAHAVSSGEPAALEMVIHTLRSMARGGIRDHLGGGFHRYSVDARWLVPHFEKMLYDNALLARLYLDAWRVTGEEDLREVCEETLEYVLADLRDPRGGFYAARDADSEGAEGLFYLWTPTQIMDEASRRGCDPAAVRLFTRLHDVTEQGNFEGRSILHLPHGVQAVAGSEGIPPEALLERLAPVRAALLEARQRREAPFRDEKVICSWSALTVRALAEAGVALGRGDFLEAAVAGGRFILSEMVSTDGLLRIWTRGVGKIPAFLEDWSAVGNACLSLHEATLDPEWLRPVRWAGSQILQRFPGEEEGVFYDAPADFGEVITRPRDLMDNATPSGTSQAVELFLRGGAFLDLPGWTDSAERILSREAGAMERFPGGFGRLLAQVVRMNTPPMEVAILGPAAHPDTGSLLARAHREWHPNRIVAGGDPDGGELPESPLFEGRSTVEGRPSAWVCRDFACRAPVTSPEALGEAMGALA